MSVQSQESTDTTKFFYPTIEQDVSRSSETTFAQVTYFRERDVFTDWDDPADIHEDVYEAQDKDTGEVALIEGHEEFAEFLDLDVGVREYINYREIKSAIEAICQFLPGEDIKYAMQMAAQEKNAQLLAAAREIRLDKRDNVSIHEINTASRELKFAFAAIAQSLGRYDEVTPASLAGNSYSWVQSVKKTSRGGIVAKYDTCNDTHLDEGDQVGVEDRVESEVHYPGEVEIRVDPAKRVEFIYTPKIESARSHHGSVSVVSHEDGRKAVYENHSLSIRLDLDPHAPAGMALDIARGAHEGSSGGRHIERSADLVGSVYDRISPSSSHGYTGFTPEMRDSFPQFAEQLSLDLYLQGRAFYAEQSRTHIARAALQVAR